MNAVCCDCVLSVTFPACRIYDTACVGSTVSDESRWCCPTGSTAITYIDNEQGVRTGGTCLAPPAVGVCNNFPSLSSSSFTGTLYKPCESGSGCLPQYSTPVAGSGLTIRRKCCSSAPPVWVGLHLSLPLAGCATPQTCASAASAVAAIVVDGGWTSWSSCSATCSGGVQTRSCTQPQRSTYGRPCDGSSSQPCNTQSCSRTGSESSSSLDKKIIIAIAVGAGLGGLALLAVTYLCCCRSKPVVRQRVTPALDAQAPKQQLGRRDDQYAEQNTTVKIATAWAI